MISLLQALWDRFTLQPDDSPEAALGDGCGFSEEEIAAAPTPVVEDLDETD